MRALGKRVPRNDPRPPSEPVQMRLGPRKAPGVGHALRPGARGRMFYPASDGGERREVVYAINSQGFRDREYPRAKPPGTVRIVMLGDSVTYGTGIPAESTLAKVLERWFAAELEQPRVEVLNFGVPATNTSQQVAYLRWKVLEWQPDMVLVCSTIVDASGFGIEPPAPEPPSWEMRTITGLGLLSGVADEDYEHLTAEQRRMSALRRTSVLADFLAFNAYRTLYGRIQVRNYRRDWAEGSPGWKSVQRGLEIGQRVTQAAGCELQVAMYPSLVELGDGYPFQGEVRRLGAFCAERNIPFFDLREPLDGMDGARLQAHAHDRHPGPLSNELVGRWLAEQLVSSVRAAAE